MVVLYRKTQGKITFRVYPTPMRLVFAGQGDEPSKHYFFVVLGIRQRGDMEKIWLRFICSDPALPMGITASTGEKRVPPISQDFWLSFTKDAFLSDANIILHTDSAATYASCTPEGVVQQFSVNHTEKEFARSISCLKDVATGESRAGMAGTMTVDRSWRTLKQYVPKGGVSCKTEQGRARMVRYVRSAQWKHMVSTADRWPAFCQAAKRVAEARAEAPESSAILDGDDEVPEGDDEVPEGDDGDMQAVCEQAWGDRYFEPQKDARCGQHALNNLLGGPQYDDEGLQAAVDELLADTGDQRGLHQHGAGWYSHGVLAVALQRTVPPKWRLLLKPLVATDWVWLADEALVAGALVNIRNVHWVAIAKHAGFLWYVDSSHRPVIIEAVDYRSILSQHPMAFPIVSNEYVEPSNILG
jgi:hypothetical protein